MKINNLKKITILLLILLNLSNFSSNILADERICENDLIDHIIKVGDKNFQYYETRNDSGIHFDYSWNKEIQKIVIKRNEKGTNGNW